MALLEERGLFWWHEELFSKPRFAPPSAVAGLLKVSDNGNTNLELDGLLTNNKNPRTVLMEPSDCEGRVVCGILKATDRRVLLLNLYPTFGLLSNGGFSYSHFNVGNCLISPNHLSPDVLTNMSLNDNLEFESLEIDLAGFEGWHRHRAIEVSAQESAIYLKQEMRAALDYEIEQGKIGLEFSTVHNVIDWGSDPNNKFSIADRVLLKFKSKKPLSLDEMSRKHLWLDDLFTVLTDTSYSLDWPHIVHPKWPQVKFTWFFPRSVSKELAPDANKVPTNLPLLQSRFGEIVSSWFKKYEEYGPGYYLYLGTRRQTQIYPEHLFASLVWGIESLHRKTNSNSSTTDKLKQKVDRILARVDNRDKRWLKNKLAHATEPTLESRITSVLSSLAIDQIEPESVCYFAKNCASLRNDISHFGAHRPGATYNEFLQKIEKPFFGPFQTLPCTTS